MSLSDDLLVYLYDILGLLNGITTTAQVIHALKQDDVLNALLLEQVTRITALSGRSKAALKYAVAAQTHIEDRYTAGFLVGEQTA